MCLLAVLASFPGLLQAERVHVELCWFGGVESRKMKVKMSCENLQLGSWCDW